MIPVNTIIVTSSIQHLTFVMFQTKYKRVLLEIVIGGMVVRILIHIISIIITNHNLQ